MCRYKRQRKDLFFTGFVILCKIFACRIYIDIYPHVNFKLPIDMFASIPLRLHYSEIRWRKSYLLNTHTLPFKSFFIGFDPSQRNGLLGIFYTVRWEKNRSELQYSKWMWLASSMLELNGESFKIGVENADSPRAVIGLWASWVSMLGIPDILSVLQIQPDATERWHERKIWSWVPG